MGPVRLGMALRPSVYSPSEAVRIISSLDSVDSISNIFLPDVAGSPDPIEVSLAGLRASGRLYVGTGVIRMVEHDPKTLLRRIETIQSLSGNRFVLGVGTGRAGPDPRAAIDEMLTKLSTLKSGLASERMPKTYIATLKAGIAKRVAGHSDGILLNFCPAGYAAELIREYRKAYVGQTDFACYVKVFYSQRNGRAERLLVEEFRLYDSYRQYHSMFERQGMGTEIAQAVSTLSSDSVKIPEAMFSVCLANPSPEELKERIDDMRKAGVTLPCVYPYFDAGEDPDYRVKTTQHIAQEL
ncbi:MAG: LLM class flavin-dependent oxidoreductase [Nitrososphaerota archaeon]|nr:LLM class flavin-dependent oxidoreductase [Nitrososphaerota archaeon]